MNSATLLAASGVCKRFGGATAIDRLDLRIEAGERVALIGPNGAGKTTAFNLITGVYPIDQGCVQFEGRDLARTPARERLALGMARTFQNIRLVSTLTVVENVLLTERVSPSPWQGLLDVVRGPGSAVRCGKALDALSQAGLDEYADAYPASLPYGVQKQIELVRALLARPRLLLLDEPAAGLNPVETDQMLRRLQKVAASGVTLLVVEHDMGFVSALCTRVLVLNFGRLIADGSPQQVRADKQVRQAYLGTDEQLGAGHAA